MSPSQPEFCCVVIEGRRGPNTGRMACPALMSETRDNMDRTCRTRIIRLMTLEAIGVRQLIVAIDVAQLTLSRRMPSSQCELCAAMIKRGRQPAVGGVTRFAAMVQNSYDVIWIRRTLVLCLVTWITVRVGELVVVVRMTVLAAGSTVLPG